MKLKKMKKVDSGKMVGPQLVKKVIEIQKVLLIAYC